MSMIFLRVVNNTIDKLINKGLKTMNTIKLMNIQNVYLNGKKATLFDVYSLKNNTYVFDYNDFIYGWYKRENTVLNKHIAFNAK